MYGGIYIYYTTMHEPGDPSKSRQMDIEIDYRQTSEILMACVENKPCILGNALLNFVIFTLLMGVIVVMKWIMAQKMSFNDNQPPFTLGK